MNMHFTFELFQLEPYRLPDTYTSVAIDATLNMQNETWVSNSLLFKWILNRHFTFDSNTRTDVGPFAGDFGFESIGKTVLRLRVELR